MTGDWVDEAASDCGGGIYVYFIDPYTKPSSTYTNYFKLNYLWVLCKTLISIMKIAHLILVILQLCLSIRNELIFG